VNISLRGVSKRFGAAVAVDALSLDIRQGELVSVVGGSGCGKTTTLRMIAGFERPDAGEIAFGGRVVNDVPPRKRDVGIVFQSYALFPTMTAGENIAFGLRVARWPEAKIRERVAEMVELTKLGGFEGRYANQLSGGQQQRVALARALARRPEILLLDEPLSALDAKIRLRLRGEIRKIQQDLGITTLYVTHDQEEALSIADRIAVMANGRIEQVGRPEEIYSALGRSSSPTSSASPISSRAAWSRRPTASSNRSTISEGRRSRDESGQMALVHRPGGVDTPRWRPVWWTRYAA